MEEPGRPLVGWRSLAEAVSDGVAIHRDDEFTYTSTDAGRILDIEPESLVGRSIADVFEAVEGEDLTGVVATARTDGEWSGLLRPHHPSSDGDAVAVTIATAGEDALVWSFEEATPHHGAADPSSDPASPADTGRGPHHQELRWEDRLLQNVVDALEDVLYVIDEDGEFVFWNQVALDRFGYTAEEFAALHSLEFASDLPADEESTETWDITKIPERYRMDLVTKDGEEIPHELHGVIYRDEETDEQYLVGVARDITEQLERERALERQRDQLATLDRINGLILETVHELLSSANRETVERTVCDRLADSDLYQFAWIGEPELDGDRLQPRVIAGDDRDYLESLSTSEDAPWGCPADRAMDTGEVAVATVEDTDAEDAAWRAAAEERDVESILAVPLAHDGTTYGVLSVYAHREDAFSERERAAFDVLGRTVGFVFYAARSRELLFADEVVELEFALDTAASMFGNAAPTLDCTLELAGYVASGDSWILYVEAEGVDPTDVRAFARQDEDVDRVRVIDETESGGRLELVVDRSDLLETVTAAGATVRSGRATPDDARIEIEAPVDADVRDVVEMITREYAGASLAARREREREITPAARPETVLGELTDRQRNVLRTAYEAGYFEWPRESTAEEVADALFIAPATLHSHLRKAERTILTAIFDT